MSEGAFRKLNIDQYDEDLLAESELFEPDPRSAAEAEQYAKQVQTEVRQVLGRSDIPGALKALLTDYPFGADHVAAKLLTLRSFALVLNSTKSSDIPSIVKQLSPEQQDGLMKFIFKGMERSDELELGPSILLSWHEKVTEVAGVGCIVRVMTDRRTI